MIAPEECQKRSPCSTHSTPACSHHRFKADKPPLLEQNGYINLPYVKNTETGLIVTQSTAVYQYLGRCFGLAGTSEAEVVAVEQTLAQAFDLRNSLMNLVYPFSGIK